MTDLALDPVAVDFAPEDRYAPSQRLFQGIPGIEQSKGGQRWLATWYAGGAGEGPANYVTLAISDDRGGSCHGCGWVHQRCQHEHGQRGDVRHDGADGYDRAGGRPGR